VSALCPQKQIGALNRVREAIDALGYIKPEYDHTLAILIEGFPGEHPFAIAPWYRKQGNQLSPEDKRRYGIRRNAYFSRQAYDCLTEKGREKPIQALESTVLRATFGTLRDKNLEVAKTLSVRTDLTVIMKAHKAFDDCEGCRLIDGKLMSVADVANFVSAPMCNRQACAVAFTMRFRPTC
jgi:hypothetical protein